MTKTRTSSVRVPRSVVGESCVSSEAISSTVGRRGPRYRTRCVLCSAEHLLVEAIGEREFSAAGARETGASRAPHPKRLAEHRTFPAVLAHQDNPSGSSG